MLLIHAICRHFVVIAAVIAVTGAVSTAWGGRIDPELLQKLNSAAPADKFAVIVKLVDTVDYPSLKASLAHDERMVRHARVIQSLRDKATASGKGVRGLMAIREQEGKITGRRNLWIINGYALTARGETIRELAARDDVAEVVEDRIISLGFAASGTTSGSGSWNLDMVGAPILWQMGYTGQGVVVAAIDSGVDINHPALSSTWRGGPHDWHDSSTDPPTDPPTTLPFDIVGHGTHVMGVMVAGNDQNGDPIGVAPGAKWIAAKIIDKKGNTYLSYIHDAFQWAINPDGDTLTVDAPNVVNCSWDIDTAGHYNPNPELQQDILALATAEIAVVFAAGNSGPNAGTSVSPANYPGAFSVGATDSNDVVTAISSRGPSASDIYPTVSIYPTVVAPGNSIRTTDLTGYAYADGTSLAAPHVAGAFALLLSIDPTLTVADLENAVKNTALDLGPAGPDNSYGYGRLDIVRAAENLNLIIPAHIPSGDVDGDGAVTVRDALIVLQAAVGLAPWSATLMYNGDVAPLVGGVPSPDGKIGVNDALLILRKAVGPSF